MFIDDLAKAFLEYERIQPNLDKLANKQQKVLDQINQKAYVRDLVIRTKYPHC